jgi:hypothetical protein
MKMLILCLLIAATVSSCLSRLGARSRRGFDTIDKEGTGRAHSLGLTNEDGRQTELFTRTGNPEIRKVQNPDNNGSLYDLEDERNNLFTKDTKDQVGDYIEVAVVSNRADPAKPADPKAQDPAAAGGAAAPKGDDLADTLIKALPNLDPGKNSPVLIKKFKMRITKRLPNGDVKASLYRESKNGEEVHAIQVNAVVPGELLRARKDITTNDLADVEWNESNEGILMQRQSVNWEDEYTLRLSGFDEAKSKGAQELDEKRKQLGDVRDQLENRIKSFSNERKQLSKDRDDLGKKAAELDSKEKGYQNKIEEQQRTIEDQQRELEERRKAAEQAQLTDGVMPPVRGNAPAPKPQAKPAVNAAPAK